MTGLRSATFEALRAQGMDVLVSPRRFVRHVSDFIDPDSPEAQVLYQAGDERLMRPFADVLTNPSTEGLSLAVVRAATYLGDERFIHKPVARRVALEIGAGVADYLSLPLGEHLF
jgi:hypothetical protein